MYPFGTRIQKRLVSSWKTQESGQFTMEEMLDKVPPEAEDPRHATSRLPVDAKYSSWDFFPSKQRSIGKSQYNCKCIIETLMSHQFDRVFLFVLVRYVSVIDKQPQPTPSDRMRRITPWRYSWTYCPPSRLNPMHLGVFTFVLSLANLCFVVNSLGSETVT